MKRFRSNLQKVFDICKQQSRMKELELIRAQAQQAAAQQRVEESIEQLEQIHLEINRTLPGTRQMFVILGMRQHLAAAEDRLIQFKQACAQAEQRCEQARQSYQESHSKVERIDRLIETQRAVYRREQLLDQQRAMDDVAIFRWAPPDLQEIEVNRHG